MNIADDPEFQRIQAESAKQIGYKGCLTCGRAFPVPMHARNKPSRCPEHRRGNWDRRRSAPGDYSDPLYLRNRKTTLAGNPICVWCGRLPATTADHVLAIAQGGTHELGNLVPACERCNRLRGASLGGQVTKMRRGRGR